MPLSLFSAFHASRAADDVVREAGLRSDGELVQAVSENYQFTGGLAAARVEEDGFAYAMADDAAPTVEFDLGWF